MLHFSCGRNRVKPGLSYLCGPSAVSDRSTAIFIIACTCNAEARHSLPAPGFNELRFVNGHPDLIRTRALTSNIFLKKQRPTHYCKKKKNRIMLSFPTEYVRCIWLVRQSCPIISSTDSVFFKQIKSEAINETCLWSWSSGAEDKGTWETERLYLKYRMCVHHTPV